MLAVFVTGGYFFLVKPALRSLTQQQVLYVDGTAQKYITPDIAFVQVGAYFNGTDAATIKRDADTALNGARDQLLTLGIASGKIQSNYAFTPKYDTSYQNITGYTAHATMSVKTSDFTQVDKILEIAQTNKLILVDNVYFTLDDPIAAKAQLRTAAIAAAKAKAETMASETGLSLGSVINISEGYNNYPTTFNSLKTNVIAPSSGTADQSSSSSDSTAINPGETQIQMTVTLTYEIN